MLHEMQHDEVGFDHRGILDEGVQNLPAHAKGRLEIFILHRIKRYGLARRTNEILKTGHRPGGDF